ncbi:hypothetical protein Vafri_18941, partial [Volvox africanus]
MLSAGFGFRVTRGNVVVGNCTSNVSVRITVMGVPVVVAMVTGVPRLPPPLCPRLSTRAAVLLAAAPTFVTRICAAAAASATSSSYSHSTATTNGQLLTAESDVEVIVRMAMQQMGKEYGSKQEELVEKLREDMYDTAAAVSELREEFLPGLAQQWKAPHRLLATMHRIAMEAAAAPSPPSPQPDQTGPNNALPATAAAGVLDDVDPLGFDPSSTALRRTVTNGFGAGNGKASEGGREERGHANRVG